MRATRAERLGFSARTTKSPAAPISAQIIGLEYRPRRVEQLAARHDHHIEPRRGSIAPENLSNQSFSAISLDRPAKLSAGSDAQPRNGETVRQDDERNQAPVGAGSLVVHLAKVGPPLDSLPGTQRRSPGGRPTEVPGVIHSDDTVRRFRPLARRRLSTRRPFLVFIRTRKPCVRRRRRLLG